MLADYQQALALLLVLPELRQQLKLGPEALERAWHERGLNLDAHEASSLAALDPAALERCARSLVAKRRRALLAALPHTARVWPALGPNYAELLTRQPATRASVEPALGPALSELLRLRSALLDQARLDPLPPTWLPALFELELARACTRRDARERDLVCSHPVHEVLEALDQGWLSASVDAAPTAYQIGPNFLRWRPARAEVLP